MAGSLSLVASGLVPAAAAPLEAAPETNTESVTTRPDTISAQITAKATGQRIEDLSQRTATEQVFANPDGSWTSESSGVVRFAEKNGAMVPIQDLGTLESAGRMVTGAGAELSIADGTDAVGDGPTKDSVPLATLTGTGENKGQALELGWEGELPVPEVKENTATYTEGVEAPVVDAPAEAPDTVDASVTIEPTRTGFAHTAVIDAAPEGDLELRFPLKLSKGLAPVRDEKTGDLRVKDAEGNTVFFAAAPTMWDSKIDEASGLPAAETRVDTELSIEGNTPVLILKAPKEWLQDTARQYPVTIDPTWTSGASDTWVQTGETGSKAGSTELRVGTWNGGTNKARSFLQFTSTKLTGLKITKAELRLENYYSYSCTSAPVKVQRLTEAWDSSDVRWTAQPDYTTSGEASVNVSKGYSSSCATGYVYYPITPIAQYWADNPTKNYGVRLVASDETNNYSWKRYRSANYVDGYTADSEPNFIVTYNSYPDTPSGVSFGTGESVKDAAGKLWVRKTKPQFRSTVSDPDGGNVKAEFDMTGTSTLTKQAGSTVASKSVSTYTPTLAENGTYTIKAWANDGSLRSKAVGSSTTFTVDTLAPNAPGITSTAGYTNNSWKSSTPTSNTFTFTSSADTDIFQYQKNNDAWVSPKATSGTATLNWSPSGANVLRVKAIDKATNTSTVTTWNFGSGPVSMTAPKAGITSTDAFTVAATGPNIPAGGTPTATGYWRIADSLTQDKDANGSTNGWSAGSPLVVAANGSGQGHPHLRSLPRLRCRAPAAGPGQCRGTRLPGLRGNHPRLLLQPLPL